MARKPTFRNSKAIAEALNDIEHVSRFLALQLAELGFVAIETVASGKRGRPSHRYTLTGKARSLLNISKNWGKRNHYLRQNLKLADVTDMPYSIAA